MRIVPDNDVIGAVSLIRRILSTPRWSPFSEALDLEFIEFAELGLRHDAPDREVWLACRNADVLLLTGNRSGGAGSLDEVIQEMGDLTSLPVVTIANVQDLLNDRHIAEDAVAGLLDYIERIDSLRGSGRLFIP